MPRATAIFVSQSLVHLEVLLFKLKTLHLVLSYLQLFKLEHQCLSYLTPRIHWFKLTHPQLKMLAHRPPHPQAQSPTLRRVLQCCHRPYLSSGLMRLLLSQQKFYPAPYHLVICQTFAHQNQILSHHSNAVQKIIVVELVSLVIPIPISTSSLILLIHLTTSHLNHLDHILIPKHILISTGNLTPGFLISAAPSRPWDGSVLIDIITSPFLFFFYISFFVLLLCFSDTPISSFVFIILF